MDIRFHWMRCRDTQEKFKYYWRPGRQNWADYWTKHFPASHHINMRLEFLTPTQHLEDLRRWQMKAIRAVKFSHLLDDSSPATRMC